MEWEDYTPEGQDDGGEDAGWITTFSDMMSLLLTFFILLFSMSSVETVKFKELLMSVKDALGVQNVPEMGTREGLDMINMDSPPEEDAVDELGGMVQKELTDIQEQVEEFVLKNNLSGQVSVKIDGRGAVILISDMVLFHEGESSFTEQARPILKKMIAILNQFPYMVRVEGHTDNVPINNSRFPSNWELSGSRASEIVRLFIKNNIDPRRLMAVGFAEYRPIADNSTAEGRSKNRRVEIVYIREEIRKQLKNKMNIPESGG